MHNLTGITKRMRVKVDGTNYTGAAGTSTLTSEVIDTAGYDGVLIRVGIGTVTTNGTGTFKAQQCDTSGGSYADLTGTSQAWTDTAGGKVIECEIYRPLERYLKTVLARATANSIIDFVEVILFGGSVKAPVTQDATVLGTEVFNAPVDGTA